MKLIGPNPDHQHMLLLLILNIQMDSFDKKVRTQSSVGENNVSRVPVFSISFHV